MKRVLVATVAAAGLVLSALPASAEAPSTFTEVIHGVTFSEYYDDDICGDRANRTTYSLRTIVAHVTERSDSFTFHYTETGTYHVDFDDPSIPDQDSQFTEANTVVLTPGQTLVVALAFHDFPTGIKIWERYHLTGVDGRPVFERYVLKVTGCP